MSILDKEIRDESREWEDFLHRLREHPDGHVPMLCRWLRDSDGRMMAIWAPEGAAH